MIGVNLIPQDVLLARRRSRRIRLWLTATAIAAGLGAVPVVLELQRQGRADTLTDQRAKVKVELATVRDELTELNRSLALLNDRLDRAEALRTKRPWAALLTSITRSMPDQVWLSSMATGMENVSARRPARAPAESAPGDKPKVVRMDGARKIDLTGYALDHEHLYEFMTGLKQSQLFATVDLVKAGKEPLLRSRAVRFQLSCVW
ncbi:MAG: PilN domain-containing protein [Planctomycetes bacterium]|nr:PilN domain-containing protein [Planctomycetota bacterium]